MKLVMYRRVSTEKQTDGYGLESQEKDIREFCANGGHEIVGEFHDVFTGASDVDDRDGLMAAIKAAAAHDADGIVAGKRDRFARGPDHIGAIMYVMKKQAPKARLISADGMGNGDELHDIIMRSQLDLFAAIERWLIRYRTMAGKKIHVGVNGLHSGAAPYGYVKGLGDGELEIVIDEAIAVAQIFAWRKKGWAVAKIARTLAEQGYMTQRGGKWAPMHVDKILARKRFYAAETTIDGNVPKEGAKHESVWTALERSRKNGA